DCERYRRTQSGEVITPVRLDHRNRLQLSEARFGPGTFGLRWAWGADEEDGEDDGDEDCGGGAGCAPPARAGCSPSGRPPLVRPSSGTPATGVLPAPEPLGACWRCRSPAAQGGVDDGFRWSEHRGGV